MLSNRLVRASVGIVLVIVAALVLRNQVKVARNRENSRQAALAEERRKAEQEKREAPIREALWAELQPVPLKNCKFERFGEERDGGYLLCANLLTNVKAGYSYGISGYDGWGCHVSTRYKVPVHQYDCFNLTEPVCKTGRTIFHGECVGGTKRTEDGRPFDTVIGQMEKNGDNARHVVIKMDIEGAEWESLPAMTDEALDRVDQFVFEFHKVNEQRYLDVVKRLRKFFHVASLHINNYSCEAGHEPFGGWAYEVLLVNKRLTTIDTSRKEIGDAPALAKNNALAPDCQGRTVKK